MKLFKKQLATLIVISWMTSAALATSYRFDFSGSVLGTNESYSGYAILDYSVENSGSSGTQGDYENAITHFELQFGADNYVLDQSTPNILSTINDDFFYGADIFTFAVNLTDTADDTSASQFTLSLVDPSMSVFSDVDLPTSLSIADFDLSTNGFFLTGVFFGSSDLNPIDSVSLAAVPLPGGLLLLLSNLGAFALVSLRK